MTELSFLLELFLDKELPCSMRDKLVSRIREVEQGLTTRMAPIATNQIQNVPPKLQQAPSTLAAMAKHGDYAYVNPPVIPDSSPPVVLTGNEIQARENSIEILKKRKQQSLKV